MILLPNITDKLQLVTSAAGSIDVHASYMDHTTATGNVLGNRQNTAITTAATTDIVGVPASGDTRNVKSLSVRNKHASSSCDVEVLYNANGTTFSLHKVTLRAGEMLSFVDGIGFFTYTAATNPTMRVAKQGSDVNNSTTTAAIISGLSLTTGTGTFFFRYMILYQSAATTTGVKFSVNHTGTVTSFVANWHGVDNLATASSGAADQDALAATAQVYYAFAARAKSNAAGWGPTVSVDTANADMLAVVEGLATVTVDGSLDFYHASEVAAQSTVKAGSSLMLVRTGD